MDRRIIVVKCPVCGEAMVTGGECENCHYSDGPMALDKKGGADDGRTGEKQGL